MTVNHEIKSHLAKLLATEDLVVEHRHVETAQFNVHTRVLTLPMWEKASGVVYDMLVGHEVGHALYTPDRNWLKEKKISPQLVNIVAPCAKAVFTSSDTYLSNTDAYSWRTVDVRRSSSVRSFKVTTPSSMTKRL